MKKYEDALLYQPTESVSNSVLKIQTEIFQMLQRQ